MKTFDPTKPVKTRDGRKARIVSTALDGAYSLGAVVTCEDGLEYLDTFMPDGTWFEGSRNDLVNVPEKRALDVWLNVYPSGDGYSYADRGTAIYERGRDATTVKVSIEYVEGEHQL